MFSRDTALENFTGILGILVLSNVWFLKNNLLDSSGVIYILTSIKINDSQFISNKFLVKPIIIP